MSVQMISVPRKKDIFRCEIFSFMRQYQCRQFPSRGKKTFSVARHFCLWDNFSPDIFRCRRKKTFSVGRHFPLHDNISKKIFSVLRKKELFSCEMFSVLGKKRHFPLQDTFLFETLSVRTISFWRREKFSVGRYFQFFSQCLSICKDYKIECLHSRFLTFESNWFSIWSFHGLNETPDLICKYPQ